MNNTTMNTSITRKAAIILAAAAIMLNSCLSDSSDIAPDTKSEAVTFKISVPAGGQPATRALAQSDEYAVGDVSVLVFDKTAKTLRGRYPGRVVSGPTPSGGSGATLTFEVTLPEGQFDLMIVANGNKIFADNAAALTFGASQSSMEAALTMDMTTGGWNTDTGSAGYHGMPMWGYAKSVTIAEGATIGTIRLTRMVAKVDVQLGAQVTPDNFKLQSVRVYNYVEQGRLVPKTDGAFDWTAVTQANLTGNTTPSLPAGYTKATPTESGGEYLGPYAVADPYRSLTNSIYLFEAPVGVAPSSGGSFTDNTCLVIGGSYEDGVTTYYRIDFARQTDAATGTTYTYMPLLRNNSYTVTVTSVSGSGHETPWEALQSVPCNITANILEWNKENIGLVLTDGIYMLGVSQGAFEFSEDAHTASDTDNLLTITTDHSGGWAAAVWGDEAGTAALTGNWLRLSVDSGNGNYPDGNPVRLILDANTGGERTAYIHIKAGVLNYIVKVVQLEGPPEVKPDDITGGGNAMGIKTYAGAFWRADQRAERLISIPITDAAHAGKWAVQVLDYGDFAEGDILFAAWDGDLTTVDATDPDDATPTPLYVTDGKTYLTGTAASGETIAFKIGLKQTIDATEHRYARVVVSFGTKDGQKYGYNRVIYLRQGHEADYLFDPNEGDRDGEYVREFSPYNLTAPNMSDDDYTDVDVYGGIWTEYPSQVGAFFQWAGASGYERRAWHPTKILSSLPSLGASTWDTTIHETCPPGYRRPIVVDGYSTSEFAQSLLVNASSQELDNPLFGYLADGFFDRREVESSVLDAPSSAVEKSNTKAAYVGMLFYNSKEGSVRENASIFFPASGNRSPGGQLNTVGWYGDYWSSSLTGTFGYSMTFSSYDGVLPNLFYERAGGFAVRCVRK